MNIAELHRQLAMAQETVRILENELAETNRGLVALTMELEQRVEERTMELNAAHAELKKTNLKLMQLTLELEDRVIRRTAELETANQNLRHEMSERKQTEEQLRDSEALYHALVENLPQCIFRKDLSGRFTFGNQRLCQVLGKSLDEIRGKTDADFYPGELATKYRQDDHDVAVTGRIYDAVEEHQLADGKRLYMHVIKIPDYDAQGQVIGVQGVFWDVTERKRAEEEILRLNETLEQRVLDRTTQLEAANQELQTAKAEAVRSNQAKSEFLSHMSHELRTPLNAILGFAQLLEMDNLGETQKNGVKHILKGGWHLLDLVNEILDLARIEAGRLHLSPEPILVLDSVREAVNLVQPMADEQNIPLEVDIAALGDWHIFADRQRFKQVLLNLLSNAIKYNREGGEVRVECEIVKNVNTAETLNTEAASTLPLGNVFNRVNAPTLRLSVKDTGPGIPVGLLERLFQPFERLGLECSTVPGTGLGLALCKRLMEAMGGTIGFESVEGRGSSFWVELPMAERPLEHLRTSGVLAEASAVRYAHDRTVLYAEDNLSNLALVASILSHRPAVKLLTAMQGQLTLDLAREHHPDMILLDVHLPDLDGDEVLRRLRAEPRTRDIPVVVLSADATARQIERLLALGARDYLTKPIDMKRFLQTLDQLLL